MSSNFKDTKIYRFSGQNQQVIGPKNPLVKYPAPPVILNYNLIVPNYLYLTWDILPTGSAWTGDSITSAGWGELTSGRSMTENGSSMWVVTASITGATNKYARRMGMSTDSKPFSKNGMTNNFISDSKMITPLMNAMLSGSNFSIAYWARSLQDFGNLNDLYAGGGFKSLISIGSHEPDEGVVTWAFGVRFANGILSPAFSCRSGSTATALVLTGSFSMGAEWHHYRWDVGEAVIPALRIDDVVVLGGVSVVGGAMYLGPTSASYSDGIYLGNTGYSNDFDVQMEITDLVMSSGAADWTAAVATGSHSGIIGAFSRWSLGETPILDKNLGWPFTIRAATGSLSRMFGHPGYIEIDHLKTNEKIGCLIGPADMVLARAIATGSYTVEAWVSASNVDAENRTLFSYGPGTVTAAYPQLGRGCNIYLDQNKIFNFRCNSGSNHTTTVTGTFPDATMSLNTWHHVQMSFQRDPVSYFFMTASCMIDGVSAGTRVFRTGPFTALSGSYWIGMDQNIIQHHTTVLATNTAVWSGRIGHFKIWKDVARTQSDALTTYLAERHFYDDKL